MIAIFNDYSLPKRFDGKKSEGLMNTFIETCRLSYNACETINKRFYLYIKENDFESPFIKTWIDLKGWKSDDVIFLRTIADVTDKNNRDIFVSMASDKKWSEPNLTIDGRHVKNMSNTNHVYEHLEFFPAWNDYSFEKWKPDFNADEKLLPVAKLSDYVWLKFIAVSDYWINQKERKYYWDKFTEELRGYPGGGKKEGEIISIFSKISSINGFIPSRICKRPRRKIVEFPYKFRFYLAPDKQHGAFEVYNERKIHQGEWKFFGGKDCNKNADPKRDICK